jgi:SAM-dependent methyltransferase
VDFRADAHHLPVSHESIDHIFSTQVLEHCYNPIKVFNEIERVLKPGGTVFLTTNQWYPLHEKPHDYFRYTRYGLKSLADDVDLVPTDIIELGSFQVRTVIRFNKLVKAILPSQLWKPVVTSTNLAIEKLSLSLGREDYTIVGIIARKP